MAIIDLRLDPTPRELRWFGPLLALFVGVVGGIARWQFDAPAVSVVLWSGGGLLAAVYLSVPPSRLLIYRGWIYATYPIGWVVSHLVLAAVYYLVVTPIGLTMRLVGRDPLRRRFEREAETYWIARRRQTDTNGYFRQF